MRFTFDAGRVAGDESLTLQFKAVYADEVKTRDIPVTIKEDIPDPVFTLKAPAKWDGRETIEVVPQIANLSEMQAKGAGELKYNWTVSGMAVIKEIVPGKLILKRAQNSGTMTVKLAVSNGGTEISAAATILVKEPEKDAWVQRTPDKDEKPEDNQFYARDDKNEGTLYYNGTLADAADSVFLKVYADDKLFKTESQKLAADKTYAFSVKLKPGLIKYKVEFGTKSGRPRDRAAHGRQPGVRRCLPDRRPIQRAGDGLGTGRAPRHQRMDPQLRFQWRGCQARAGATPSAATARGEIGYWGMDLARHLVESQKMPICIINGAVGGTRIDQHQRNPANHTDTQTIYGRLLWRVEQARLTHGIRGVFWHQGENDQGAQGPTGGYGWETYRAVLHRHGGGLESRIIPIFSTTTSSRSGPNSCSMGGNGSSDKLRDVQRTLPRLYSNMSIMSTLGIKPPGPCHYPPAGYAEMARLISPLVERDNYGKVFDQPITPPDLKKAYYTSDKKDEIALEFDQPMAWNDALASQFYLDGEEGKVASGAVSGNVVKLKLAATRRRQNDHLPGRQEVGRQEPAVRPERHRRAHLLRGSAAACETAEMTYFLVGEGLGQSGAQTVEIV